MNDILILFAALTTFAVLNLLPAWLPARRWLSPGPWPVTAAVALLLSFTVQSLCGLIWGRFVRVAPDSEGMVFLCVLLALTLAAVVLPRRRVAIESAISIRESVLLGVVLLLGLGVRSLHPLQHWALGQSDAYTHLLMIRQLLAQGFIGNESYPSGFAWIMSLPVTIFGWDPYHLARFGGAFFGLAMILAVYALLRVGGGTSGAALCGAALVAWFPGLMLLIKTGVGVFANQVGLFLLPMVFVGYLLARQAGSRARGAALLFTALVAMALTVPMMLLHALLVLAMIFAIDGRMTVNSLLRRIGALLLLTLPATLLIVCNALYIDASGRANMIAIITSGDQTLATARTQSVADVPSGLVLLCRDFLGVKRCGLSTPLLDAILLVLLLAFIAAIAIGLRRRQRTLMLLGCWGTLAAVQSATGWLQFTAYQREGWSLLIATGVLGGVVFCELCSRRSWLRPVFLVGLACSCIWTLTHPPSHLLISSSAEEELIRSIRMLREFPQWAPPSDDATSKLHKFLAQQLNPCQLVAVCSRSLNQTEVLRAIAGPNPMLRFHTIVSKRPISGYMARGGQFLVVLDEQEDLSQFEFGIFGDVSPALRADFVEQQRQHYATNHEIESYVAGLSRDTWHVAEHTISPHLRMLVVRSEPAAPFLGIPELK